MGKNVPMRDKILPLIDFDVIGFVAAGYHQALGSMKVVNLSGFIMQNW